MVHFPTWVKTLYKLTISRKDKLHEALQMPNVVLFVLKVCSIYLVFSCCLALFCFMLRYSYIWLKCQYTTWTENTVFPYFLICCQLSSTRRARELESFSHGRLASISIILPSYYWTAPFQRMIKFYVLIGFQATAVTIATVSQSISF